MRAAADSGAAARRNGPGPDSYGALATHRGGFTLMELVAVVAVLAVVALLAAGRYGAWRERAQLAGARQEMATLRAALLELAGDMEGTAHFRKVNPLGDDDSWEHCRRYEFMNLGVHDLFVQGKRATAAELDAWRAAGLGVPSAEESGWQGPYLKGGGVRFPGAEERRFPGDATFSERGFHTTQISTNGSRTYSFYARAENRDGERDWAKLDPWGNPYVVQVPGGQAFPARMRPASGTADDEFAERRWQWARLVSAGPDGVLETPREELCAGLDPDGAARRRGDDLVLFLNREDVWEEAER